MKTKANELREKGYCLEIRHSRAWHNLSFKRDRESRADLEITLGSSIDCLHRFSVNVSRPLNSALGKLGQRLNS